ncbi:ribonuclease H-like domain-containing protein [Tanacetum coccineum]|uniref:Ribonuclease H-like domain-containing protein n=1 Tax=Tanacetum coccineum TaxID=301880 RepID=A0ABQ4WLQ1_9ASTR
MSFVTSPSSTNEVNTAYGVSTANTQVSLASTQVSTTNTQVSTANLSDDTVYAFLASQPNGSQLVYEDLEQILKNGIEEMDLKWQLALLSMRTGAGFDWSYMTDDEVPTNMALMAISDSEQLRRTVNVEETSSKAMVAIDELGYFTPNLDLSYCGLEEFQQLEFEGYRPKSSKSVSKDISNEVRDSHDALLVEELVSDDKLEKKTIFPMFEDRMLDHKHRKTFGYYADCNYHQRERVVSGNNYTRIQVSDGLGPQRKLISLFYVQGYPQIEDQGYVDSGCSRHMTSNMSYLSDFKEFDRGYVTFRGGAKGGKITGKRTLKIADKCQVLLKVPRKNNMHNIDMKNIIPKESLTYLVAKATLDELMLWHRRLVVTDDYCIFTWVFFLPTKYETSGILKSFITEVENLVDKKVKIIRCDNGTEFKNRVMSEFCKKKGIKKEFSVARTP